MQELTLQEIQQNSFKVLLKFKEICDDNGYTYYLAYGTLLGAIRHKGFIPWDDDIDVWMPRSDYEKFINFCILNNESLSPFTIKHYKSCKEYIYPIARLVDTRYKIDYSNTKDYDLGLFIDIYPLDGVNMKDKKQHNKLYFLIHKIFMLGLKSYVVSKNKFKNIFKFILWRLTKNKDINKLIRKVDVAAQKYDYDNTNFVGCAVWECSEQLEKSNFSKTVDVNFNGSNFKAPVGYDNLLSELYGDYMKLPPKNEQVAHHFYSVYKKD